VLNLLKWTTPLILLVFVVLPTKTLLAQSGGEEITEYKVRVEIQPDGTLLVTEDILYDFGENARHGIYREIPKTYSVGSGKDKKTYPLLISDFQVRSDSAPDSFIVENTPAHYRFKIGDPNKTVTGQNLYTLTYKAKNAINYFEEFDEVYWNATGNEWNVPIKDAVLTIALPETIPLKDLRSSCYEGARGSTQSCDDSVFNVEKNSMRFSASNLAPREGLTGALGFPKGTVPETPKITVLSSYKPLVLPGLVFLTSLIAMLTYLFRMKKKYRQEPKGRDVIVRQYDPPKGMSPAEMGFVVDKKIDNRDISAEIVYLAQKGYIHILAVPQKILFSKSTQFYFLKMKDWDTNLSKYQQTLMTSLFSPGYTMDESEKAKFMSSISENSLIKGDRVKLSERLSSALAVTPLKVLENKFYVDLNEVKDTLKDKLLEDSYLRKSTIVQKKNLFLFTLAFLGIFIYTLTAFLAINQALAVILILITFLFFLLALSWTFPGLLRTEKGVEAREHALGLKEYLSIAEKDRLEFHFNPKNNPELFEKLLPFAIVLKVEREWAKELDALSIEPDWYTDGSSAYLTAGSFYNSFSKFNTAASSSYAPPSSSGSGGGGSSGGGSGGGGGGSW